MKNVLLTALLALATAAAALAQVRPIPAFHAIKVGSGIALDLTAGPTQRVAVEVSPAEYTDDLKTTVADGVLTLRFEHPNGNVRVQRLHVAITADQLTALTAGGGAAVTAQGAFAAPEFQLELTGGAAVRADMATTNLVVDQSGGSTLSLNGQATKLTLDVSGGAVFNGAQLQATTCQAQASGGSIVRLSAKDQLTASASGGSSIKYHGAPQVTKSASNSATIKAF
ncbi:MAG: head GIN domain-containing protein [Janthinobacterium lividum]